MAKESKTVPIGIGTLIAPLEYPCKIAIAKGSFTWNSLQVAICLILLNITICLSGILGKDPIGGQKCQNLCATNYNNNNKSLLLSSGKYRCLSRVNCFPFRFEISPHFRDMKRCIVRHLLEKLTISFYSKHLS